MQCKSADWHDAKQHSGSSSVVQQAPWASTLLPSRPTAALNNKAHNNDTELLGEQEEGS